MSNAGNENRVNGGRTGLYDVRFAFDPRSAGVEAENVWLRGEFLFYKTNLIGNTDEAGMMEQDPKYPPAQYEEGMASIGGSYLEEMKPNESGIYELTLRLPAGSYIYNFVFNAELTDPDPSDPRQAFTAMTLPDGSRKVFAEGDAGQAKCGRNIVMKDPANLPQIPSVTGSIPGSVRFAGTPEECRRIPIADPSRRGTTTYLSYTDINGKAQSVCVYLPAGFDRNRMYPLVLVSHGGGGNEAEWTTQGNIDNVMDNLIAEGRTREAILVMMNNTVFSRGFGDWDFESISRNIEECILPLVEKILPVSRRPEDRAFCGLSMGSMTTLYMYYHRTELYKYYGAFSGGIAPGNRYFSLDNPALKDRVLMIGTGEEDIAYNERDIGVPPTIRAIRAAGLDCHTYFVTGSHDWFCWPAMFEHFADSILWK